jgi:predicted enzyme related to lactoylglutathione lyase
MGTRTSYEPGTFSWVDLGTTDREGAKGFYQGLFGWDAVDNRMEEGDSYSIMLVNGESVAAIYDQPPQQREAGMPPFWFSYVTVASADDAAAAAKEAGGSVHAEPFDVMQAGRMAVIGDPTGAMFGVWEARDNIGAGRVNELGCLTWNELATNDVEAASNFYTELFGWSIEELDTGGGPRYWSIGHEGGAAGQNGGVRELGPAEEGVPPNWLPYFGVESVDGTLGKAGELGAATLVPGTDLPTGRFAVVRDPQGAVFALFEGEFDE